MNIIRETKLDGCYELSLDPKVDMRGVFVKTFNYDFFNRNNLNVSFKESFYTKSKINVLRGLHFQTPPFAHDKLVYCSSGSILDVVIDLRKFKDTYGQCFSITLTEDSHNAIYIPKGMAHGFLTLANNSIVNYITTETYSEQHDCGILWNSIPFQWPIINPIISNRDQEFISFNKFDSPF